MLLAEARERTLLLVEPVSDPDLDRVHDPLMSPLVWDLGHIAAYEDVWVCHRTGGLDLAAAGPRRAVRRLRDPARGARRHALPAARRGARLPGGGARALAGGARPRSAPTTTCGSWWPSTSTSTTRRCCRPSSWPIPACSRPSVPPSTGAAAAGTLTVPGGAGRARPRGTGLRLRQRAAAAPRGARPVRHRPRARDERRLPRVRGGRRLPAAGAVVGAGLGAPAPRGLGAAALLDARRGGSAGSIARSSSSPTCR